MATIYRKVDLLYFVAQAVNECGCNHYLWTSSTVGKDISPKRDIDF